MMSAIDKRRPLTKLNSGLVWGYHHPISKWKFEEGDNSPSSIQKEKNGLYWCHGQNTHKIKAFYLYKRVKTG